MAGLFLIMMVFFFLQRNTDKFDRAINLKERSSVSSRLMIWRSALKIGLDNPIIGIGPGNFQSKYLEYQKYFPPYLEWAVPQPHNLLIAFWLQTGIIGLCGFLALLGVWLKTIAGMEKRNQVEYICLGIIIYILVHGMADTTYFKNDLAVVFWLTIFSIKNAPLGRRSV